jgi:hypothetical protein
LFPVPTARVPQTRSLVVGGSSGLLAVATVELVLVHREHVIERRLGFRSCTRSRRRALLFAIM